MAQMRMTDSVTDNLEKTYAFVEQAADSDLLFFPEIQATPFFPQYPAQDVEKYRFTEDHPAIARLEQASKEHDLILSPNFYMKGEDGKSFDRNLWITPGEGYVDSASMVHVYQAENFYEVDYYTPSEDGFKVFDTPYGKVGIVICFDRHIPESIRTCALKGADLILIPTANTAEEDMEFFEWEVRVQAMQSGVFLAMCNRVGREGNMTFAGESIVVDPKGNVLLKADDAEQLITLDLDLSEAEAFRKARPWNDLRTPQFYL